MVKNSDTSEDMRTTPRVLALEASKRAQEQQTQQASKVAMSRRIPKKKRLEEIDDALRGWKSQQEEGMKNHETPFSGKAILPSDHQLPDKKILEFVIDALQRKDKSGYFAEPVDGDKVDEYYDYIENPMDFGTMRAKLHEGVYTTLKQFQDDVYLISKNAMIFNASSTVYYKKALAIQELADWIFNTLENNPENFIEEFSKKQRYGQKSNYEAEGSGAKDDNKAKRKRVACCRSSEQNRTSLNFNAKGWRDTYQPPTPKQETYICSSKQLVLGSEDEPRQLGYADSLRLFSKDLGPVAQNLVNQKLMALNQMQSRSLLVPYESQENAKYNNFTTAPGSQLAVQSSNPTLKRKPVLGSESLNNNTDVISYVSLLTADSPPHVSPRSHVYPSTIIRESSVGPSGNMFRPNSNFSQMTQQPMIQLGAKYAHFQPQNMLATQNSYFQQQNTLGAEKGYFQQQKMLDAQMATQNAYIQQPKSRGTQTANFQQQLSTQHGYLQQHTIRDTQNANLQQPTIRETQMTNLQQPTIRDTQRANLQQHTIRDTQNANLQQRMSLGAENSYRQQQSTQNAYLQQKTLLGTQKDFFQSQKASGAQSSFSQLLSPLGRQTQLQNPLGAHTSFSQMPSPLGAQNFFLQPQTGTQTSFSQLLNPIGSQPQKASGAQSSFSQLLSPLGRQTQLQNPLGAHSSFSQMPNPLGAQNSFLQPQTGAQTSFSQLLNPTDSQTSLSQPMNPSGTETSFMQLMNQDSDLMDLNEGDADFYLGMMDPWL